ncbi:protein FAM200C-like [Watersipora subatra]|uniref:protein FAM200C-like n=1 Tax=Watersipora subatra TaxID=2589382 RepID=UPI00355B9DAF
MGVSRIQAEKVQKLRQVIEKIKSSPMFPIQLDESTDVASISQLMVFAAIPLTETTTAADVMNLVSDFFSKEHLDWGKLIGVCTDGAPAMLGCRAGFAQLVKEKNPLVVSTHCFIHRQALAAKTLPKGLQEHPFLVIKVVNLIKGSALQTRFFHKLCKDVDAVHSSLLFQIEVRWLSKGNMLLHFFNLRAEVNEFLKTHNKPKLLVSMLVEGFHQCLAYLVDIFGSINEVNTRMQGRDRNVLNVTDSINAFKDKLKLWVERLATGIVRVSFPVLHSLVDKKAPSPSLLTNIKHHLNSLIAKFERYFLKLDSRTEQLMSLTQDPFRHNVHEILEQLQEEFLELKNNSAFKDDFKELSIEHFWVRAQRFYPNISLSAFKMPIPFAPTYLCESAFSAMLTIKSKSRNCLEVEADLRLHKQQIISDTGNDFDGNFTEIYDRLDWLEEVEQAKLVETAQISHPTEAKSTKDLTQICVSVRLRTRLVELDKIPTQPVKKDVISSEHLVCDAT